jgi:hypothetical protein
MAHCSLEAGLVNWEQIFGFHKCWEFFDKLSDFSFPRRALVLEHVYVLIIRINLLDHTLGSLVMETSQ